MTVKELIEELLKLDPELDVVISGGDGETFCPLLCVDPGEYEDLDPAFGVRVDDDAYDPPGQDEEAYDIRDVVFLYPV